MEFQTHDIGLGIGFKVLSGRKWRELVARDLIKPMMIATIVALVAALESTGYYFIRGGVWGPCRTRRGVNRTGEYARKVEAATGTWRRFVNARLAAEYQIFYGMFSHWVVLQPPSFEAVVENRMKREDQLRNQLHASGSKGLR